MCVKVGWQLGGAKAGQNRQCYNRLCAASILAGITMHIRRVMVLLVSVALIHSLSADFSACAADTGTLTEIARLGRGWIGGLAWTAHGDAVLAASMSGVWRYGLDGGEERLLPPSGTQIGPQYVIDITDRRLTITALATGQALAFQPELASGSSAAFSPDQTHLAIADGATIDVWLLPQGEQATSIPIDAAPSSETVTFSPDNRYVAAVFTVRRENVQPGEPFDRDEIRIWDASSGAPVATLTTDGLDFLVTSIAFSEDNKTVITSRVGGVTVYKLASGDYQRFNLAERPLDHSRELRVVHGAVFSHAESRIVGAWFDISPTEQMNAHVTIWDAHTGAIMNELHGLRGYVRGLTPSPDGSRIAVYSYEGSVLVWDLEGEPQMVTDQHPAAADVLAAHGDTLAAGGFDSAVRLWSVPDRRLRATIFSHSSEVQAMAFSEDGLLASASRFDTWTWSLDSGVQDVDVLAADALALGFRGSVLYGVVSSPAGVSSLWKTSPRGVESTELGVSGDAAAIADERVAVHTLENMVLYDLGGVELARFLPGTIVHDLSFSPDATRLLVGGGADLSLWDVETAPALMWQVETNSPVVALAFSPDGSRIVLGTSGGGLELRRADDGTLLSFASVQGTLADVIFSPDGRSVITAIDTQIVIWSAN